jgi:hypothetical protein
MEQRLRPKQPSPRAWIVRCGTSGCSGSLFTRSWTSQSTGYKMNRCGAYDVGRRRGESGTVSDMRHAVGVSKQHS